MIKRIVTLTSFLILTLFLGSNKSHKKVTFHKKDSQTILKGDSGFVSKENGIDWLLKLNKNDSVDLNFNGKKSSDTIGKFYKKPNSPNYYVYLSNIINPENYPSHYLFELNANGEILESELFLNGNYLCCVSKELDAFYKIDDYFFIKVCTTGSAFCASEVYAFKDIESKSQNPIINTIFNGMCLPTKNGFLACKLSSSIEIKPNSLIFHYRYDKGSFKKSGKFKTKMSEQFDVEYVQKNKKWMALDSTKLKQLDY